MQVIRPALEARLKAWAAAKSFPVAWQNVAFTKPTTGVYIEPFIIPTTTVPRDTSATNSTSFGIFQVNVWTRYGTGLGEAEAAAESLRAAFPIIPRFCGLQIEKAEIGSPLSDSSGWIATPVVIGYRYDS